jgi:Putative quorum-sensing-regulated virulence factor
VLPPVLAALEAEWRELRRQANASSQPWYSIQLSEQQKKLVTVALCPGAHAGEISNAALALIQSLRRQYEDGHQFLKQLETDSPPPKARPAEVDFGSIKMPFGRHKDKSLPEVPVAYLKWFLKTCLRVDPFLRRCIYLYLKS